MSLLEILYIDESLVAINKPSGLLVHRSKVDRYETQFAVQLLRDQLGKVVYPVHRLDKPTSGVLLFAFSSEMTGVISQQWNSIKKCYLAISRGELQDMVLDYPVKTINAKGDVVTKNACTAFKTLATAQLPIIFGRRATTFSSTHFSLLHAFPKTGRQHQIRKHLKHLNHPIVGDTRYGRGEINRHFRKYNQVNRLLFHCQSIYLKHPKTNQPICLFAPLDSTWHRILGQLPWST